MTINRPTISGITVEPVTRQGAYFHKKLALDNSARPDVEEIAVVGVKAQAGTGLVDIVSSYSGVVWAAQSPEQFSYDADGNMLADALRRYEWDGENRLIAVTASNVVDGSLTRVEFSYDYMSRRASKTVYAWSAASNEFQISSFSTFIYDGWNLIKELSTTEDLPTGLPTSRVVDYYVWGLDLSGSLQGAGGIGGLLGRVRKEERFFDDRGLLLICHRPPGNPENYQTIRINASAWPAHEAHGDTLGACAGGSISNSAFLYAFDGNGNVSELLQSTAYGPQPATPSAWSSVAHYEYSPFGELIVSTGPEAQDNPFRFSTKYFVDELGIGDWGRRWYIPPLGRWLSRDPIGEKSIRVILLYTFVGNNPVVRTDFLGLDINVPYATPQYCCGTPVQVYEPKTSCCCKNNTVVMSDFSPECKLVARKEVESGVVRHKAIGIPIPDSPGLQIHVWLSWPGSSADANAPNNTGKIGVPAAMQVDDFPQEDIKLSPCEYDFSKLHKCLSNKTEGQNGQTTGQKCYTFVQALIDACKADSATKGCTAQ